MIVAGSQVALSTDYSTSQSELFDPTLLPNYDCECYIPDEPTEDTGSVSFYILLLVFSFFYLLFTTKTSERDILRSGRQSNEISCCRERSTYLYKTTEIEHRAIKCTNSSLGSGNEVSLITNFAIIIKFCIINGITVSYLNTKNEYFLLNVGMGFPFTHSPYFFDWYDKRQKSKAPVTQKQSNEAETKFVCLFVCLLSKRESIELASLSDNDISQHQCHKDEIL